MIGDSSSSLGVGLVSLLTGTVSPGADIVASFRFGDNRSREDGLHEFLLACEHPDGPRASSGHITWDPSCTGPDTALFAVGVVRLEVSPGRSRWSVGTTDFVECGCRPYRRIRKVQMLALAASSPVARSVQWDAIDITIVRRDGTSETHTSPCLPRAGSIQGVRRTTSAAARPPQAGPRANQQYAELVPYGDDCTRLLIRAQVTLKAQRDDEAAEALGPDDLYGAIHVFTDSDEQSDGI